MLENKISLNVRLLYIAIPSLYIIFLGISLNCILAIHSSYMNYHAGTCEITEFIFIFLPIIVSGLTLFGLARRNAFLLIPSMLYYLFYLVFTVAGLLQIYYNALNTNRRRATDTTSCVNDLGIILGLTSAQGYIYFLMIFVEAIFRQMANFYAKPRKEKKEKKSKRIAPPHDLIPQSV